MLAAAVAPLCYLYISIFQPFLSLSDYNNAVPIKNILEQRKSK